MDRSVPDWMKSSLWSSFDDRHHAIVDAAEIPTPRSSIPPNQPDTAVLPPPPQRVVSSPPAPLSHHAPETPRSTPAPPLEDASHGDRFHAALSKRNIDLAELRMLTAEGVPDSGGIRSVLWKVLLGYLPTNRDLWAEELSRKRAQYASFKEELLLSPSELARRLEKFNAMENEDNCEGSCLLHRSEITHGEHPLSLGETSIWNKFFQDTEIMKQIDRDIKRTHPDMDFFCGDSPSAKLNQEALKHVLAVFAKLNPGIQYVQGMNEILAPLFYVFRNDADEQNAAQAEPDSFFCFVTLLSGFRDHFCQQLDNSIVGIRSTMSRLTQILREHDEELWRHLEITTKFPFLLQFPGQKSGLNEAQKCQSRSINSRKPETRERNKTTRTRNKTRMEKKQKRLTEGKQVGATSGGELKPVSLMVEKREIVQIRRTISATDNRPARTFIPPLNCFRCRCPPTPPPLLPNMSPALRSQKILP